MRQSVRRFLKCACVAAFGALTACSGSYVTATSSPQGLEAPMVQSLTHDASRESIDSTERLRTTVGPPRSFVYTCQWMPDECDVYSRSGTLLHSTTEKLASPLGVDVDAKGRWYVANFYGDVLEYEAGSTQIIKSLASGCGSPKTYPEDVAVRGDVVAVSNSRDCSSGVGSVSLFVGGATKPTRILRDFNDRVDTGSGIAFDSHGNCFWSTAFQSTGTGILEFPSCAGGYPRLIRYLNSGSGLAIDGDDNLYFSDLDEPFTIYKCIHLLHCQPFVTGLYGVYLKFAQGWKNLYVSDEFRKRIWVVDVTSGKVIKSYAGHPDSATLKGGAGGPGPPY